MKQASKQASKQLSLFFVIATLVGGCDPDAELLFIEPHSTSDEASFWLAPLGASQSAGASRLGSVFANIDEVRYNLRPRQSAFLFRYDIDAATEAAFQPVLLSLQLPAVALGATERTILTTSASEEFPEWSSFRVYDQGTCSVLTRWPTLTRELYAGLTEQFGKTDGVKGAELRWGELSVLPQSHFGAAFLPPDVDRLRLRFRWAADAIAQGIGVLGCNDVRMTVDMEVELEPTDMAWSEVPVFPELVFACGLGVDVEAVNALLDGEPWASWRERCDENTSIELPHFGRVLISDIDAAQPRRTFSGRDNDQHILLGLRDLRGHPLGAHDTLARTLSIQNNEDFVSRRCTRAGRRGVKRKVRNALRQELVLGLSAALREQAVLDPLLVGVRSRQEQACQQDDDCNAANPDGPAFQNGDAWQGARHVCRTRDTDALRELLGTLYPASAQEGDFCYVALEPDRLNVRPDGAEIVLVSDLEDDVQGTMFFRDLVMPDSSNARFIGLASCDENDNGLLFNPVGFLDSLPRKGSLRWDESPRESSLILPVRVEGE